jgi:hypothetical protein
MFFHGACKALDSPIDIAMAPERVSSAPKKIRARNPMSNPAIVSDANSRMIAAGDESSPKVLATS